MLDCFSRIRTFFYWCNDNKKTLNKPFDDFPLEECTYGTPYYITIDEWNKIYATNLSRHSALAVQRDIFVFQCLIGCRVGDLIKMTKESVINGAIEYIPRKTKEGRPLTVRVPLNDIAKEIVERYQGYEGDKLLPFISEQKYNVAIKCIFMAAGLKRMVTVVNPTTREEEKLSSTRSPPPISPGEPSSATSISRSKILTSSARSPATRKARKPSPDTVRLTNR